MKKILVAFVAVLATAAYYFSLPNTIVTAEQTVVASQQEEKLQETTIHVTGTTQIVMKKPQSKPQN